LVVDLTKPEPALAAAAPAPAGARPGDQTHAAALASESADEKFRDRVGAEGEPDRARATMLRNQKTLIPQGTLIPAVLETALNSDLPGFARAVVSRDVSSFDGARVLVPRGSRVIGEYKSAVALGQSRAFVIWTRIIRPDGASIQIGSGGGDPLGRAGLAGSVDNHFFERFGGAVLLTVLNAAANAAAGAPSTEVVIGSSQQASGLAGSASAFTPSSIPPTIKVPQGTPLRIFVAKDLDFSAVEGRAQ
jgi:type IV secretion system protein VirB10